MTLNKIRTNVIKIVMIFSVTLSGFAVYAQQEDSQAGSTSQTQSSEKKHASYMEIIQAKKTSVRLIQINRGELARLKIYVSNFGSDAQKKKYEELSQNFKSGYKDVYKRKYIEAQEILLQNRKEINVLLQEVAESYQNRAADILNRCADQLVERELAIDPSSTTNPDEQGKVNRLIIDNNISLLIAYDQLNMGDRYFTEERFSDSVVHFRIAKMHGIQILINLAVSEDEREKLRKEFAVDLDDGNNRVNN